MNDDSYQLCFLTALLVMGLATQALAPSPAHAQDDSGPLMTFDVSEKADVYVLYDSRGVNDDPLSLQDPKTYLPPSWLDSNFVRVRNPDSSLVQLCTADYGNLIPFKRTFDKGTVRLGGAITDAKRELGVDDVKDSGMYAVAVNAHDGEIDGDLITNLNPVGSANPDAYAIKTVSIGTFYTSGDLTSFTEMGHDPGNDCQEEPLPAPFEGLPLIATAGEDGGSGQDVMYEQAVTRAPKDRAGFRLGEAYPNPFSNQTRIDFTIDHAAHVTLTVYNVLGRRVATLADRPMQPGSYKATWNGSSGEGTLPSGVYLYRLQAGSQVDSGSLTLLH